ncbi:MAG: UDP-N-acetylmuramoyl-L-alanine--D-glutamate ligase [Nocardioidaceae bacterium]
MRAVDGLTRLDAWDGVRALVAGFGVSGFAAADALVQMGARVTVVEDRDDEALREKATVLGILGADVRLGAGATAHPPDDVDVVVTSPGWNPRTPLLAEAARRGTPIWGEVELAWRLRAPGAAPWLCLTGTNGKTTTVQMLDAILRADGRRCAAVGNVGTPVIEAVMHPEPFDVLAVELSSFQLHWTTSLSARAAAVLNIAPDHASWYAGDDAAYVLDKGRVYQHAQVACVYNVSDPRTEELVRAADVVEGCRAIGFTLGMPAIGMVGIVDDLIADRAFVDDRATSAAELASVSDVHPAAPHNVANALAAASLARAHGVAPRAVRDGLRGFRLDAHRIAEVATLGGVRYVDDSKATNPAAAQASLLAYEPVVWIAGGLAKGASFDQLVAQVRGRLRAVVLLGQDRAVIAQALARHAPDVPVIEVPDGEDEPMDRVVDAATESARPGDTVLLAPGCASQDMFTDYGARGDAFAAAVLRRRGQT